MCNSKNPPLDVQSTSCRVLVSNIMLFLFSSSGVNILKLTFSHFKFSWMLKIVTSSLGCVMVVLGVFVFGNSLTYNLLDEFEILT